MSEHTVAATDAGGRGYRKNLKKRRINVIAIGGAIGTGLFLGTGDRLHRVDPRADLRVRDLRRVRLHGGTGAGGTRRAPPVLPCVRLLCAGVPR
jgi:hypothetical protein